MKTVSIICLLVVAFVALFAFAAPAVEGQVFLPHVGSSLVSPTPTPTVEITVAFTATSSLTPSVIPTATFILRLTPTATRTPTVSPTPSQSPTITPTPTKTGTPTTTPTVTPTPTDTIGDGVIVLNSHFDYVNEAGMVTVVGEVRNDTKFNASNVRVTVTLYNNRKDVVDSLDIYTWREVLIPTEKTCFEVVFPGNPTYNRYSFATDYLHTESKPRALEIVSNGAIYLSDVGAWHVTGQVRNHEATSDEVTTAPLPYPQIVGTLYAVEGHVVDCLYVTAVAEQLAEGESSIWEMTFRSLPEATAHQYRVQAK